MVWDVNAICFSAMYQGNVFKSIAVLNNWLD